MMSNALYISTLSNDVLDSMQLCGDQLLCSEVKDVLYQLLIRYKILLHVVLPTSRTLCPTVKVLLVLKLCPGVKDALYQLFQELLALKSCGNIYVPEKVVEVYPLISTISET